MEQDTIWGDHLTLTAAATAFNVTIRVISNCEARRLLMTQFTAVCLRKQLEAQSCHRPARGPARLRAPSPAPNQLNWDIRIDPLNIPGIQHVDERRHVTVLFRAEWHYCALQPAGGAGAPSAF